MRSAGRTVASSVALVVVATAGTWARAEEPPPGKASPPVSQPPAPRAATSDEAQTPTPDEPAPPQGVRPATPPGEPLQVAGDPPDEHGTALQSPPTRARDSDGAGPRITFGRAWTEGLDDGFYGRFETEYFEVTGTLVAGALLGLEGWGTEGATAGGGSVSAGVFGGVRGGPFRGPRAPKLFFTLGAGLYVIVYDRIGDDDGFGLLSPFGVATAGMEVVPGVRLLCDTRAVYRWHWTAESQGQIQVGLTLGLNSYLWDGP